MCGYCIEKMVLVGMAKGENLKQLGAVASSIYLQEADDLLTAKYGGNNKQYTPQ